MKRISALILLNILLSSIQLIAQDFRVPAGQIKLKEDYTEYEMDIVAADKWLLIRPSMNSPNEGSR